MIFLRFSHTLLQFRIQSLFHYQPDTRLIQLAFHKFRQSLYLQNSRGFKIASVHVLTKSYYLYIYVLFFAFAEAETLNIAPACVSFCLLCLVTDAYSQRILRNRSIFVLGLVNLVQNQQPDVVCLSGQQISSS